MAVPRSIRADHFHPRPEGRSPFAFATAAPQDLRATLSSERLEFPRQARFADARLAGQHDEPAASSACIIQRFAQGRDLAFPPHEAGRGAYRCDAVDNVRVVPLPPTYLPLRQVTLWCCQQPACSPTNIMPSTADEGDAPRRAAHHMNLWKPTGVWNVGGQLSSVQLPDLAPSFPAQVLGDVHELHVERRRSRPPKVNLPGCGSPTVRRFLRK